MGKTAAGVPADKIALYDKLIATVPDVERKGATVPYTSLNGHMFSYLGKTGTLALRLPEGPRDEFLVTYRTSLCRQYGVVQKEYVDVPDALLARTDELGRYFAMSHAYVASLKPKPTTRSRAAGAAKPGAAKSRAAKSGAARSGAKRRGAKPGAAKSGAARSGAKRRGAKAR